jgi:hypothetical protein
MQMLEKLDGDLKHYEGKRGACIGFFQLLMANDPRAPRDQTTAVLDLLKDTSPEISDAADIVETLSIWASSQGLL